jgi:ABC-type multidrug transport system fused ATPase/permease subunit
VLATTVAMAVLDWRLTLASFAILPLFVWMTRRVGRVRKALAATMQGSLADISTLVEESLSVSGVLLAKTMGQTGDLTQRFSDESRRLADLELRQRMAGRWMMATIQATFAIMPALMYGIAGYGMARGGTVVSIGTLVAFTTLQTRLLFPIGSLLNVQADLQTSTALSTGCSSTSTCRSRSRSRPTRCRSTRPVRPARSSSATSASTTTRPAAPRCATSTSSRPRAAGWRSWARPGPARPRSAI